MSLNEQLFDLERIQQLTQPLDNLEDKLNSISDSFTDIKKVSSNLEGVIEKETAKNISTIITELDSIGKTLFEISESNVNQFLQLKNILIDKYRENFKNKLKRIELNQNNLKTVGLHLIEHKNISKIVYNSTYTPSISVNQWIDLLESLKQNSLFLSSIPKIKEYYLEIVQEKLQIELEKVPENIDPSLIQEFKNIYMKNPVSFRQFLTDFEAKLSEKKLKDKEKIVQEAKELGRLENLKKKQKEQKASYKAYFKYSDKEFQRIIRKKKRKKLSEISKN